MRAVSDVMTKTVYAVTPEMSVYDAITLAGRHDVAHLPVLRDGHLVGLVCTCDLDDAPLDAPIGGLMHPRVRTIAADAPLETAAEAMEHDSIGSLLVLDDGAIVGILTREDLAHRARETQRELSRCAACGSFEHLRPALPGEPIWCTDCAQRRTPPADEREIGSG